MDRLSLKQSNSNADDWRSLNELSDEVLVLRLLDGEQDALAVLFDRYHRLVFSVAARIVQEDSLHDFFRFAGVFRKCGWPKRVQSATAN